jgi:lactate permease
MHALLGALPALTALALIVLGIQPIRASLLALAAGIVVLLIAFPTPVAELWSAERTAVLTALEVLAIMLGGVMLYETLVRAHTFDAVAAWLLNVSRDPGTLALLMALGVTPFAESVTGFGVGILFSIPLLQRVGFDAFRAVVIGLLGLIIVPWGSLAPSTLVAARLTGVSFDDLGTHSAILSLPVFLIAGSAALIVSIGLRRALLRVPQLLLATGVLGGTVYAVNASIGPPLAGALGAAAATIALVGWARLTESRLPSASRGIARALIPYGLLVGLLLAFRGCAAALGGTEARNGLGRAAAFVLTSPALPLLLTVALSMWLLRLSLADRREAVRQGVVRWRPVAVATAVFVLLGGLMAASGMAAAVAQAAVDELGSGYLFLSPWVGGLGGYVTGSNTASNAMLATAQAHAADQLGYPVVWLVAVQNVSGALLTMLCAPRIALALTLVDAPVGAARVTRIIALADGLALAAIGGLAYLWL